MAEFASLPLFTDAYLADAGHLSFEEHGRYLLLLIHMWRSPGCRLPDDDEWLARRFHCDASAVRMHMRPLIVEFMQVHDGWITQKRLQQEWQWCHEKRNKNINAANTRWSLKNNKKSECERNAGDVCERNAPTPSPSPSLEKEKSIKEKATKKRSKIPLPAEWESPPPECFDYAFSKNWDRPRIAEQWGRFHNHAIVHDRRCAGEVGWRAAWRNWVDMSFNKVPSQPNLLDEKPAPVGFYAPISSPQLEAWDDHRKRTEGKTYPRDKAGGWTFPTEWPPDHVQRSLG